MLKSYHTNHGGRYNMTDNKRPESMKRITDVALAEAFTDEQIALVKKQVGN